MEEENAVESPRIGASRKLARSYLKVSSIKTCPILLKEIASHIPDLYIDGVELEDQISGMQATYKGISFIRFNSKHDIKRNRFTVAHELGHLLLGHTSGCGREVPNLKSTSPFEVEANQFAAELLMPLHLMKKMVSVDKTVSALAARFWVSRDAMSWRVMDTRLFNKLESWY